MSAKRSRATYEADLQAQQSPFVLFGTPLPPLDPEVRDDGSYIPVWKQEVRDDQGRKRLHGAFTGGFSAGYFNTVGSKEGWTPSTFVSSRSNRRKDDPKTKTAQQRPEDFMDEEDLADAEESRKLQTAREFAALGSTEDDFSRSAGLAGLFRVEGGTMGVKLLKKMGWRDGQGIGPKVLRKPQLGVGQGDGQKAYLFAPENVVMIRFERKTDHKGLGYAAEARLTPLGLPSSETPRGRSDEDDEDDILGPPKAVPLLRKKKDKKRGGIGIGILNDTGSDDEDPYEIGPRISYNRVIAEDKKKKKKDTISATAANPLVKSKPVFKPKRNAPAKAGLGSQRCHDGRFPLEGFVFRQHPDPLVSESNSAGKYPPPEIPADWKSSKRFKRPEASKTEFDYESTADAAKGSRLDPKSRAELLGEKQLPGKSVFDFLSASARDRIVNATGKTNLPEAKGEIPATYAMSAEDKLAELLRDVPYLEKETAVAAISRGAAGGGPYADNEAKRSRYRAYLEYQAGFAPALPSKPPGMKDDDWLREFYEFFNCARIFKPMSGFMATRFTTSSSTSASKLASGSSKQGDETILITKPLHKPPNPAEEAAKMGMHGPMTRSTQDFYPTRLLCKRFNVKPPVHVQPDAGMESSTASRQAPSQAGSFGHGSIPSRELLGLQLSTAYGASDDSPRGDVGTSRDGNAQTQGILAKNKTEEDKPAGVVVDPSKNEALEGSRAGEEVFRSIFGDSSDEEE